MPEMRVVSGPGAGQTFDARGDILIGRDEGFDLGGDPELSRRHARITTGSSGELLVEDLGSTNGTLVNGHRISVPTPIRGGDRVELGGSVLEVVGEAAPADAQATRAAPIPQQQAPPRPGTTPPPAGATPLPAGIGGATHPAADKRSKAPVAVITAILGLIIGAAIALVIWGSDDESTDTTAASATGSDAAGWMYVVSNAERGNSVLAIDYRADGSINPLNIREFSTEGKGATIIPGKSLGTLAGDSQVTISPDKRFLFAVNQGSDTVAVFRIDRATGALEHVEGSPFPSGGRAPSTTGFNGQTLIVVNKGILPGEKQPGNPQQTNYASFAVSDEGALTPVNSIPAAGTGPTAAVFAPNNRVVFGAEFYGFQINGFTVADDGKLAPAAGMPKQFPASMVRGRQPPPGLPPDALLLPYGVAVHPTEPFIYVLAAQAERVAIYRYDEQTGAVTFVGQVDNPKTVAACWARVTSDGRFLYTGNSGSHNISVFGISDGGAKLERIELQPSQVRSTIHTANITLDESEGYLFALASALSPDAPANVPPGSGNYIETYKRADDGTLGPIGQVALPVPTSTEPVGLAAVAREG
ncbi:MAG: beta-propeller fold lactonase family protein [Thermoleophilaceae bacterium]